MSHDSPSLKKELLLTSGELETREHAAVLLGAACVHIWNSAHFRRLTQTFPITNENTGGKGGAGSDFRGITPARLSLQAHILSLACRVQPTTLSPLRVFTG